MFIGTPAVAPIKLELDLTIETGLSRVILCCVSVTCEIRVNSCEITNTKKKDFSNLKIEYYCKKNDRLFIHTIYKLFISFEQFLPFINIPF